MLGNFSSCCLSLALSSCEAQLSSIIIGQWLKFCDFLHTSVPVRGFKQLGKHSQSDFFLNLFNCMCVAVLLAVCVLHVCSARGDQKMASDPWSRVTGSVAAIWCWESNPHPPEEQPVLVTTEQSLQPIGPDIFLWLHSGIVWQLGITSSETILVYSSFYPWDCI